MTWLYAGPAHLIAWWPYVGVAIATVFIGMEAWFWRRRGERFDRQFFRQAPVFAGILWLIFGFYEQQMQAITRAAGATPLRLDLMVLTPILYVFTALALWTFYARLTKR